MAKAALDLNLGLRMVLCPTIRDSDGLALSSRNRYLSPAQRQVALALPRTLATQARLLREGRTSPRRAESAGWRALSRLAGLVPDYVAVRQAATLGPCRPGDRDLVLLGAVRVGKTRLIDNLRVSLKSRP